jgi:hypothetical protein
VLCSSGSQRCTSSSSASWASFRRVHRLSSSSSSPLRDLCAAVSSCALCATSEEPPCSETAPRAAPERRRWPGPPYLTLAASRRDRRRRCSTYVGARALCAVVSHIALDDPKSAYHCHQTSPPTSDQDHPPARRRVPCHRAQ